MSLDPIPSQLSLPYQLFQASFFTSWLVGFLDPYQLLLDQKLFLYKLNATLLFGFSDPLPLLVFLRSIKASVCISETFKVQVKTFKSLRTLPCPPPPIKLLSSSAVSPQLLLLSSCH